MTNTYDKPPSKTIPVTYCEKSSDISLGKDRRIKHASIFQETFSQQNKIVGKYMIIWLRKASDTSLKLGIISSKKMHLKANKRNRARRRLREIYRQLRPYLSSKYDVIIIARRSILEAQWLELYKDFIQLAIKGKLIAQKKSNELLKKVKIEINDD